MAELAAGSTASTPLVSSPDFSAAPWPAVRKALEILGWLVVLLLLYTGLSSILGRALFLADSAGMTAAEAGEAFNPFDIRYWEHYAATVMHLVTGVVIFVFGPLQFSRYMRRNFIGFHRWSGRAYIACGTVAALSGGFIGIFYPFAGLAGPGFTESMATLAFASYVLFCLYRAYSSIRARQFGAHREWMIRSFALMLGIATERVMLGILMANTNIGIEILFGATFWMAGVVNIAASEIWIQLTRTPGNGAKHWKDLDAKAAA